jgi:hypothetical protein
LKSFLDQLPFGNGKSSVVNQNTQISHRKLALPTPKQVGVGIGVILGHTEANQFTLMEVNF